MSIWLTEVDRALKTYIQSLMSNVTSGGTKVKVPVKMFNPDIIHTKEQYPVVTINSLDHDYNLKLSDVNSYSVEYDLNHTKATIVEKPTKLDISYQIDFWSKTQTLINAMTYEWVSKNPKFGYLDIVDDKGNTHSCPFDQVRYLKLDSIEEGEAIYRRSYECKVTIEVPRSKAKVVGVVHKVSAIINTDIK